MTTATNGDRGGSGGSSGSNGGEATSGGKMPTIAGKTTAALLGEIVWLMSQSPAHKQFFIADLEWMVMTPLLLQQFRIYYAEETQPVSGSAGGGLVQTAQVQAGQPIGVVFWGFVDAEVEGRLKAGNAKLRPQDWRSGDRLWVVDVLAPASTTATVKPSLADQMVADLKLNVFPDRPLNLLTVDGGRLTAKAV